MGQRFVESVVGGEDLVLDRATGLQWGKDWTDGGGYDGNMLEWANAVTMADGSGWAGLTDWRLPNVKEIFSLLAHDAAIFPGALILPPFINVANQAYWTSTTYPGNALNAYYVSFGTGVATGFVKTNALGVCIVRGGL